MSEALYITLGDHYTLDKPTDIILSPSFYWVRKESLPVNKLSHAKRLLPSLFESYLPIEDIHYDIFEADNGYIALAYNPQEIAAKLEAIGIAPKYIKHIHTAQSEFANLAPLCYKSKALFTNEGIVCEVEQTYLQDEILQPIDPILAQKRSSHKLYKYTQGAELFYEQSAKLLNPLLLMIVLALAINYIGLQSTAKELKNRAETLLTKHELPSTSFELNSIEKSLLKLQARVNKIRAISKYLSELRIANDERIEMFKVTNNDVEIGFNKLTNAATIEQELKKRFSTVSLTRSAQATLIKIAL